MIVIKKVRHLVALVIIAASILVLLCSCRASDKELIIQLMPKLAGYNEYQQPAQFRMEEPNDLFRKYGARYYRCTWVSATVNNTATVLPGEFLIKHDEVFPIKHLFEVLEVDFDHDDATELIIHDTELIIHNSVGSGIEVDTEVDTYYVIEKGEEPIHYVTCWLAKFEKVQDGDYIIRAITRQGKEVLGVLKYRFDDGVKTVYIDAGEDTDALEQTSYQSPFSEVTKN